MTDIDDAHLVHEQQRFAAAAIEKLSEVLPPEEWLGLIPCFPFCHRSHLLSGGRIDRPVGVDIVGADPCANANRLVGEALHIEHDKIRENFKSDGRHDKEIL